MSLGLENAYGQQAGWDALHQIIAERKKDEILKQAEVDKQRQMAFQEERSRQQDEQFRLTNERLIQATQDATNEKAQTNLEQEGGRVTAAHAIGDLLTPHEGETLVKTGQGALVRTPNMPQTQEMLGSLGAVPGMLPTLAGRLQTYGGTAQQQHQATADELAAQARKDAEARDARNQFQQDRMYGLAVTNANRPVTVLTTNNEGQLVPVGTAPHGARVLPNPDKLLAGDMQMKNAAIQMLPHIQELRNMADELNKRGLIGPVGSRWADFVAGKIGSGEIAAGDPEGARLLGKFRSELKLVQSGTARAHAGARGAGSETLLKHMSEIEAGGADMPTFMGSLDGVQSFMEGYAQLGEEPPPMPKPSSAASTPGAGLKGSTEAPAGGSAPNRIRYDSNGNRIP